MHRFGRPRHHPRRLPGRLPRHQTNTLYTTFKRLEQKGLIVTSATDTGGKAITVTPLGDRLVATLIDRDGGADANGPEPEPDLEPEPEPEPNPSDVIAALPTDIKERLIETREELLEGDAGLVMILRMLVNHEIDAS